MVCTVSVSGRLTQLSAEPWFYRSLLLDQLNNFGAPLTLLSTKLICKSTVMRHNTNTDHCSSTGSTVLRMLGIHFETNATGDTSLLTSGSAMLVTVIKNIPRSDVTSTSLDVLYSER